MSDDAPRSPSARGPAWQRAIDFGVDVSLLEENLRLTPEQRLAHLLAMQRRFDAIHGTARARPPEGSTHAPAVERPGVRVSRTRPRSSPC